MIACDRAEHFLASAGTFIWAGPNILPTQTNLLGGKFILNSVHGSLGVAVVWVRAPRTALQPGDKAMLLENCGQAGDTSGVIATLSGTELDFGHLTMDQGILSDLKKICPRLPGGHLSTLLVHRGAGRLSVALQCAAALPGELRGAAVDLRFAVGGPAGGWGVQAVPLDDPGGGLEARSPFYAQEAGGPNGMDCVISPLGTSLAFVWFILLTMLFLALFGSLRVVLRQCRCHGSPRYIEDISTQRGKLMIRTAGATCG